MSIKIVCTRYREAVAEERRREVAKSGEREKPSLVVIPFDIREQSSSFSTRVDQGVDQGGVLVKKTNCSRKSKKKNKKEKRNINHRACIHKDT